MPYIANLSCRFYALLLHLYPIGFRREFEDEMLYCFTELIQDAWLESGWSGLFSTWFWVGLDVLYSLMEQRWLFWREIMFNKSHGKTLLASMSVFVITGTVLFCYGFYNLVLHPGSYLRKPAVLFSWNSQERLGYSEFVISRVEIPPETTAACETIPLSQFQPIPQTNLRSQYTSPKPNSIVPAEFHKIRDSYQVNRASTYCYHVAGIEADGSLTSVGLFSWWGPYNQKAEFVIGNLAALLVGLLLLFLGIRLNSLTRQLPSVQPTV